MIDWDSRSVGEGVDVGEGRRGGRGRRRRGGGRSVVAGIVRSLRVVVVGIVVFVVGWIVLPGIVVRWNDWVGVR